MIKLVNLVIILIEFYLLVKNSTLFKAHDIWEQELLAVYLYIFNYLLYLVLMSVLFLIAAILCRILTHSFC